MKQVRQGKAKARWLTYGWNLKNNINEQTKQKQTHRHRLTKPIQFVFLMELMREQTGGCQRGGGPGVGEKGEGTEKDSLVVTK